LSVLDSRAANMQICGQSRNNDVLCYSSTNINSGECDLLILQKSSLLTGTIPPFNYQNLTIITINTPVDIVGMLLDKSVIYLYVYQIFTFNLIVNVSLQIISDNSGTKDTNDNLYS
jgi:hypothetical protein